MCVAAGCKWLDPWKGMVAECLRPSLYSGGKDQTNSQRNWLRSVFPVSSESESEWFSKRKGSYRR